MSDLTQAQAPAARCTADAAAQRWRHGDQSAARDVWEQCGGRMLRLARAVIGSRAAAEDAVQEAFLRAWRAIGRYDPQRAFEPWLATIVVRECRRALAKETRRRAVLPQPQPDAPGGALFDAVENLPCKLREVVALHHMSGYSVQECAQVLQVPLGTVKSRLHRARAALAAQGFGGNRHGQ